MQNKLSLIVAILFLFGFSACDGTVISSRTSSQTSTVPGLSASLERDMASALENSALENVRFHIRRSDGRNFVYSKGTTNERYLSSSTAKPPAAAAILDQVQQGNLSLDTRVVDILPEFGENASPRQRDIRLRHLLSFTSGMVRASPACWSGVTTQQQFSDCIDNLPTQNNPNAEPGIRFLYSSNHLDIAGQMAVVAGGFSDWGELFRDWSSRTGLFRGVYWLQAIPSAGQAMMITTEEYINFLQAVNSCTLLDERYCAMLHNDQHPANTEPEAALAWVGEDWHFTFGMWLECRSSLFNCRARNIDRLATIGNAAQYAFIDRRYGFYFVIGPLFGGAVNIPNGLAFARSIDNYLVEWARLARSR